MKMQTIVIDTSDTRMFYTMKYLRDKNLAVSSYNNYNENAPCIYCFSPQKRFSNDELHNLKDKSYLFCGKLNDSQIELLDSKHITYYNLLNDELFAIENAMLTAEGALMLIIRGTNISIFDMNIAILGYGRVGKAMSSILKSLGVNFTIYTNDYYEKSIARLCNKNVYDLNSNLCEYDTIINTIPAKVLSFDKLKNTKKTCYILDLASFSSAEMCDINSLGLAYDNVLGIPGKYTPKTAGEILAQSLLRTLEV